jgi:prophage antirepressor-like protein
MAISKLPEVFQFESSTKIRTFFINGSPWFVAKDVCDALQLTNSRMSLQALDEDEKAVSSTDTLGGRQRLSIISESGLYTLILRCRDAVTPGTIPYRFRKWVTAEVLPAIRRTGQYSHKQPEVLGDLVGAAEKLPTTATTMTVRDGRRGKTATTTKAAQRIADECVPMIMKAVQNQYHYSNTEVGPQEVIPALLPADGKMQLRALLMELAENGHNVGGAFRELEVMRYVIGQHQKLMSDIASHAMYIQNVTMGK